MKLQRRILSCIVILSMALSVISSAAMADMYAGVEFPPGIEVIEAEAYRGCTSFYDCDLDLSETNLRRIESKAFKDTLIRIIELPSTVNYIADDAFDDRGHLEIYAPYGSYAYKWAADHGYEYYDSEFGYGDNDDEEPKSSWVEYVEGDLYDYELYADGTVNLCGYSGEEANLVIPSTIDGHPVRRIGYGDMSWTFEDNDFLESVTIPEGVEYLSASFAGCVNLKDVNLPSTIKYIVNNTFSGCRSLESIIIPKGLICLDGFRYCSALKEIAIPDSVLVLGMDCFWECTSLEHITIPSSITILPDGIFEECTSLREMTIPNNVTSIGYMAFAGCTALKSITIPDSVKNMEERIFLRIVLMI